MNVLERWNKVADHYSSKGYADDLEPSSCWIIQNAERFLTRKKRVEYQAGMDADLLLQCRQEGRKARIVIDCDPSLTEMVISYYFSPLDKTENDPAEGGSNKKGVKI